MYQNVIIYGIIKLEVEKINKKISRLEEEQNDIESKRNELARLIPNLLLLDLKDGKTMGIQDALGILKRMELQYRNFLSLRREKHFMIPYIITFWYTGELVRNYQRS